MGNHTISPGDYVHFVGSNASPCPDPLSSSSYSVTVSDELSGLFNFPRLDYYVQDSLRLCLQRVGEPHPSYFPHVGLELFANCNYGENKDEASCFVGVSKGKCSLQDFQVKCPVECGVCSAYPPSSPP